MSSTTPAAQPASNEELVKRAAAEADAILEREVFIPALIKTACVNGVPEPRTEEDVLAILDVVNTMVQTKQAMAAGAYPELRAQVTASNEFEAIRRMAKRAHDELEASRTSAPSQGLQDAIAKLFRLNQATPATEQPTGDSVE